MVWPRALRELKDLLYEVYLAADTPSADAIAADIGEDMSLPASPSGDNVRRCISGPVLGSQADVRSVAAVLARHARWDAQGLVARVCDLWVVAKMAKGVGRPLGDFDDWLALSDLEVHPALDAVEARDRLGALPPYVPREFDAGLDAVVAAAAAGRSSITVLVGGSSTGKTRALWEAVRKLPDSWRLWHPIAPTRPDAVLVGLPDIAPKTVVWLNEAQHYLAPDLVGEQVAAGLRDLLRDPARGPVLVLATLWPEHWESLTTRTDVDRHAHARELLLRGRRIDVPDEFTDTDLAALMAIAGEDPRLAEAAERSQDRQVTQYLAGVPVLMDRYNAARGATRALIYAAMDARRLGAGPRLPLAWLADAAPGYLTTTEGNQLPKDWLSQALDRVTRECDGIPGILTAINTSPLRNQRSRYPAAVSDPAGGQSDGDAQEPQYELADYLHQYGRRHRVDKIPPIDFWTAAARHADTTDLTALGDAAWDRGLYWDAAQLHKLATTRGDPSGANALVRHLHALFPTDHRPAQWAVAHVSLDDPRALAYLLRGLQETGAVEQAAALAARAAAHVPLDDPAALAELLYGLRETGAGEHVATLLARDPAAHVAVGDPGSVGFLLDFLMFSEAVEQAAALAARAAPHVALHDLRAVERLLLSLRAAGAVDQVAVLAGRAAAHVSVDDPDEVAMVLDSLQAVRADAHASALLARDPAAHVALHDLRAVGLLVGSLRAAGADEQAAALASRAAAHVPLDDAGWVSLLLHILRAVGAVEQAEALTARAAAHVALDDPRAVDLLLGSLRAAGADDHVATLLARDLAAQVDLDHPGKVASLLYTLRRAGADEDVAVLLARDLAAHVVLDAPGDVAKLVGSLRAAGAVEQADALAARAAAHVADNQGPVAVLLDTLRAAGADEHLAAQLVRDFATYAALDHPGRARVLNELREAGAVDPTSTLIARLAIHADLRNPTVVTKTLAWLREAGAVDEAAALVALLPAAGHFQEFIEMSDHREGFRYGREPEGGAAPAWTWENLK
ncbi:hypothetical protein T261_8066 [Streptomyces lydicus]|nr:hypothetical protein T261_8066 [Streptomyces lydicus]